MKNPCHCPRVVARWAVMTCLLWLLLFLVAGTTQLASLRNYLATYSTFLLAIMLGVEPGLAEERARPSDPGGLPGRFAAGLAFLITLMIAALDLGRIEAFGLVPAAARWGGLLFFAAAMGLEMWAMTVNPFFSPDIRLQSERGHQLIACGPYRFLRHPGYLAMVVATPSSALAIGSWLALVPAATFCLVIVKRVGAEERFLEANLAGYGQYMARVPGRFIPHGFLPTHPIGSVFSGNDGSRKKHWRHR